MSEKNTKAKYPRVYVSAATHEKVRRLAIKRDKTMKDIGNEIVLAGLREWSY